MTAPTLNLDQLEATALAAGIDDDGQFNASNWYVERDIGNVLDVNTEADALHIIAASPAVVLELIERVRTAQAEAEHYRSLAIALRKQQMGSIIEGQHSISHRAALLMFDAKAAGLQIKIDGESASIGHVEVPHAHS